jgi:hypothetical protein
VSNEEAIVTVVFLVGAFVVLRPLAAALARRIGGEVRPPRVPESDAGVQSELQRLRDDVDQLAERVDFAERLLAKQREVPRIGQGG